MGYTVYHAKDTVEYGVLGRLSRDHVVAYVFR
jgi:hypothetical protein